MLLRPISLFVDANFFTIATDRYGCCLVKKMIEREDEDWGDCSSLLSRLLERLKWIVCVRGD